MTPQNQSLCFSLSVWEAWDKSMHISEYVWCLHKLNFFPAVKTKSLYNIYLSLVMSISCCYFDCIVIIRKISISRTDVCKEIKQLIFLKYKLNTTWMCIWFHFYFTHASMYIKQLWSPSIYLSICISECLSICLSVCLYICLCFLSLLDRFYHRLLFCYILSYSKYS